MEGQRKIQCLVIMPFGSTPADKLLNDMVYDHIIVKACIDADVHPERIDRHYVGNEPLSEALERSLKTAPLVIADLSGNNPNVLFELGFRRAQGKPFICISRNPVDAAFWPRLFQIVDYTAAGGFDRLASYVSTALKELHRRLESEEELLQLLDIVRRPEALKNPWQDRVACWRISRARADIKCIENAEWEFEAKTSSSYVSYVLTELLKAMRDYEEFLTVSNIEFWASEAVGNAAFLNANIDAAHRGVDVKRLLLVDKKRCADHRYLTTVRKVARQQLEACARAEKFQADHLVVRYKLCDDYPRDRASYGHFAVARRRSADSEESGSMLIEPRYDCQIAGQGISQLQILFPAQSSDAFSRLREKFVAFQGLFAQADDISKLARRSRVKPTSPAKTSLRRQELIISRP
jgi:hypothetical protein